MSPGIDVIEELKLLDERKSLNPEFLPFFQSNEEYIQSLLVKIEKMKFNMGEHVDDVIAALPYYELEELEKQGRKVKSYRSMPAYVLYDHCKHEIKIEDYFCLVIETIITPQGWRFKVYATEFWNRPVERENQRAIAWYEAQAGPRTFPYSTEPSEVAAQLRRLIESAMTDPFPLPE